MTRQRSGIIVLHLPQQRQINEDETNLLKAILAQGSIALQNAYYFHEATNGRDRLAAILNSIEEGILLIDIDGRVLLANEPIRILSGHPLEELINSLLFELPKEVLKKLGYTQPEIISLLEALGQTQVPISPKTIYETRDAQRTRMIERITAPVWGQDSTVIGWMILVRDITEEHEIEQAREAITETVVHDLRSPMSAIVGALEMLSECLLEEDDPIIQQSLLVAQRSASRVLALTEALLDIARLQSGRMEIDYETIHLSKLVAELLAEFTTLANDDSVIIRSEIPAQLPAIRADRDKLIRVLTNLVDNAIKFSSQGGSITISAEPATNDQVAIKVKDSGPGVPVDYQEKIFERFVQIPGRRGRRRGSGLGLAFCRLTVEAHGGRIWVESPPEGGSIFTFTLPVDTPLEKTAL
jgi:PAS domain S-box-containing protein